MLQTSKETYIHIKIIIPLTFLSYFQPVKNIVKKEVALFGGTDHL